MQKGYGQYYWENAQTSLNSGLRVPTSVPKLLCFPYNYRSTRGKQLSDFEWRWGVSCGNVGFVGEGRRDCEKNFLHDCTHCTCILDVSSNT